MWVRPTGRQRKRVRESKGLRGEAESTSNLATYRLCDHGEVTQGGLSLPSLLKDIKNVRILTVEDLNARISFFAAPKKLSVGPLKNGQGAMAQPRDIKTIGT